MKMEKAFDRLMRVGLVVLLCNYLLLLLFGERYWEAFSGICLLICAIPFFMCQLAFKHTIKFEKLAEDEPALFEETRKSFIGRAERVYYGDFLEEAEKIRFQGQELARSLRP
jgi:hypothetical protein